MRTSDKNLHDALLEAGLPDLAARAAKSEWNDYFGKGAMNIHDLVGELDQVRSRLAVAADPLAERIDVLIDRAMHGDFDATKAEADEWAASDEGKQAFRDLMGGA